ncbi:glycogen synthase GlgA [Gellertiella hungarica]|uniref:Glycogen synthase n=1 Tax=Gellertiella hungarica TaxID=1572859 RepID=A0A7W6J1H3_9HYPH|nr:glycogen synthase GlgA [Gellertiella hungarica]MBB4063045.1 starch synthase [Gellertiella hungarica]
MNILSVTSEIYPLVKTGGLADVAGALPLALKSLGIRTRTLVPGYPAVMKRLAKPVERLHLPDVLGVGARLLEVTCEGLELLVLDCPALYDRVGGPYLDATGNDFPDNWKRFAALSWVGAEIAGGLLDDFQPDLVHAHDWQGALTPVYMRYGRAHAVPSVLTIHNIAFQGQFGFNIFAELRLPPHAFAMDGIEYYGDIGYLKGGLQSATAITTVSPSYAGEILQPSFGMGLEGVIAARENVLHGIVNGIDVETWDPARDPEIAAPYSAANLKPRAASREALCEHFNLDRDSGPIFSIVSRLTWQKGMDLLPEVVDDLVAHGGKLAILGSGDAALEGALLNAAARHRGRIGITIGYNEQLSHLLQAGADAILVPSRFEPCGLTQLYALRYGCIPVVARTGGLADTVIDANHAALQAKCATGVQFSPINADGLRQAIHRTIRLYADRKLWTQIQKQGMKADVSWIRSAGRYAELYSSLISRTA